MTDHATISGANRPGPVRVLSSLLMPAIRSVLPAGLCALLLVAWRLCRWWPRHWTTAWWTRPASCRATHLAEAEAAIQDLQDESNVQLWALFVDSTGGQPVTDFADAVAAENGLGGNDALLVVAIDDRRDALWVGDLLDEASDEDLDSILAEQVEPSLADGEWGAAVAGAASGLADALDPDAQPEPEEPAPEPEPGTSAGWRAELPRRARGGRRDRRRRLDPVDPTAWRNRRRGRPRAGPTAARPGPTRQRRADRDR